MKKHPYSITFSIFGCIAILGHLLTYENFYQALMWFGILGMVVVMVVGGLNTFMGNE